MFRWRLPAGMGRKGTRCRASEAGSSPAARQEASWGGCGALSSAEPSQTSLRPHEQQTQSQLPLCSLVGNCTPIPACMSADNTLDPLPQHPGVLLFSRRHVGSLRGTGVQRPPTLPSAQGERGAQRTPSPPTLLGGAWGPAPRLAASRAAEPGASCHKREPLGWRNPSYRCFTALHPQPLFPERDFWPGKDALLSLSSLARGLGPFPLPQTTCKHLPSPCPRGGAAAPWIPALTRFLVHEMPVSDLLSSADLIRGMRVREDTRLALGMEGSA